MRERDIVRKHSSFLSMALLTLLAVGMPLVAASAPLEATHLRCEYLTNPLGIEEAKPRLSWVPVSDVRGERQTAYQILVASTESLLTELHGDLWDSGAVQSDQTVHVEYQGVPLKPGMQCFWKVRVWGKERTPSAWSESALWTMGLPGSEEWKDAKWIGESKRASGYTSESYQWIWFPEGNPSAVAPPGVRYFRRVIRVPAESPVLYAKFYLTCDNGFRLFVNGRQAGESCDWSHASILDIKEYLVAGENTLAIAATNESSAAGLTGKLTVRFQGREEPMVIGLDPSWKTSDHEIRGWESVGFDDSAWSAAMVLGSMGIAPWGVVRWPDGIPVYNLPPSPFLRRDFTASKPIRRATLYATALGCYEAHVNGQRVGRDYFSPGWQEFRKRVYYQTYDVTPMVRQGDNAIGVILSDGWYSGYIWAGRDTYGTVPKFRAQLRMEYMDGTVQTVATDETWKLSYGPIREGDVQQGETYDARLELPGWDSPSFRDADWQPVAVSTAADVQFGVSPLPPVRRQQEIVPVKLTEPRPGVFVFDLGQNIAGWARIKVRGEAGTKIVLRHSGMLNPDGTIYTDYLREARAIDTYYLKGTGEELWEPSTTYHGFQYVELTGYPGKPAPESVVGVVCHSDLPTVGVFDCSDARVNKLYSNILWTLRDNLVDIPTGCADRAERLGWCDHNLLFRTECYMIGMAPMLAKWMIDVQDSQSLSANGSFLQVAPIWGDQESPGWSDVGITGVYYMYRFYGDTRIINKHYASMARYIEHIRGDLVDGLRPFPYKFADGRTFTGYGDWLSIVFDMKHNEVLNNLFNCRTVGMMAEMAEAVGKTADATEYRLLFNKMKAAINAKFVSAGGEMRDKTQAQYAMALEYGILPEDKTLQAVGHLADDIVQNSHQQTFADAQGKNPVIPAGHLTTGFHGTRALLPALSKYGRDDVAYALLLQDTYPSWLYLVKLGATSIWERWDSWTPEKGFQNPAMNSFNMPNLGASIGEWLFAYVGGIESDGAGFQKIRIEPHIGAGLDHAKASYDSVRGTIRAAWEKRGASLVVRVTIPANCIATVCLPTSGAARVTVQESGKTVWSGTDYVAGIAGISAACVNRDRVEMQVDSGTYEFTVEPAGP